jgi:DNA polymerase III delta prime subunit
MIIIAGKAGVGKTTLAKIIAKEVFECGLNPVLLSFAGPLKEEAKAKGYDKEKFPDKYRAYCQEVGATMREANIDHWVDCMRKSVAEVDTNEGKHLAAEDKYWESCIVIDDCRYVNEVAYGKEKDAVLLFLSAGKRKLEEGEWREHHTEHLANLMETKEGSDYRELFNHLVFNDKDIPHLEKKIKDMVPIWCGITVSNGHKELLCSCEGCRAKRENRPTNIDKLFLEMLDLIDEEWDEDEETK